jgi:choline-sulfatase
MHRYAVGEDIIRRARHAYYGMISYVDDLVGRLLRALDAGDRAADTIVVFTGDHGEMLGERGLWYKMTFFEWASRVPLLFHAPGRFAARRETRNVSLVDLLPTLLDLASGGKPPSPIDPLDGHSLASLLAGPRGAWDDLVAGEYLAEGALAPCLMVKRGTRKLIVSEGDPDQLYDLASDPDEIVNRAGDPTLAVVEAGLRQEIARRWDAVALKQRVIDSQRRRLFLQPILTGGRHAAWDYQPVRDAARAYVRNIGMDEDAVKGRARLPFVPPAPPDR